MGIAESFDLMTTIYGTVLRDSDSNALCWAPLKWYLPQDSKRARPHLWLVLIETSPRYMHLMQLTRGDVPQRPGESDYFGGEYDTTQSQ